MVTKKIVEETLEIETTSVEDTEMLVTIDDGLCFLLSGIVLPLHLSQKTSEVSGCHDAILIGVTVEKGPYLRRGLRHGDPETPAEAEAEAISLFARHVLINVFSVSVCVEDEGN